MSAPFAGVAPWPEPATAERKSAMTGLADTSLDAGLARLNPPRKHYQWYYSTEGADAEMHGCPQGVHAFLRAYYHMKSADWPQNRPERLAGWGAEALAALPTYYIMNKREGMAETVRPHHPTAAAVAANRWLPDRELAVYAAEYGRTTFQGGLNWYRCVTGGLFAADLRTFMGKPIGVPAAFIAGRADWGIYQKPGDFEAMQTPAVFARFGGAHILDGAGHWVQQEQPARTVDVLRDFLARLV
jgi:pimeloyl-ACP methyl ester carboxylesterase